MVKNSLNLRDFRAAVDDSLRFPATMPKDYRLVFVVFPLGDFETKQQYAKRNQRRVFDRIANSLAGKFQFITRRWCVAKTNQTPVFTYSTSYDREIRENLILCI